LLICGNAVLALIYTAVIIHTARTSKLKFVYKCAGLGCVLALGGIACAIPLCDGEINKAKCIAVSNY